LRVPAAPGGGVIDATIPLAGLAAGSHVLRVEARVQGKSVSREIPFDVK